MVEWERGRVESVECQVGFSPGEETLDANPAPPGFLSFWCGARTGMLTLSRQILLLPPSLPSSAPLSMTQDGSGRLGSTVQAGLRSAHRGESGWIRPGET